MKEEPAQFSEIANDLKREARQEWRKQIQSAFKVMNQALEITKCLQTETAAELDALLPSILDNAFKGELC